MRQGEATLMTEAGTFSQRILMLLLVLKHFALLSHLYFQLPLKRNDTNKNSFQNTRYFYRWFPP